MRAPWDAAFAAAALLSVAGFASAQAPSEKAPAKEAPPAPAKKAPTPATEAPAPADQEELPENGGAEPQKEAAEAEPGDTPPPAEGEDGQELPPQSEGGPAEDTLEAEAPAETAEAAPAAVPLGDDEDPAADPAADTASEEPTPDATSAEGSDLATGGYEDATLDDGLQSPEPEGARFVVGLWWDVNMPLGPSRDFVKKVDPAGFQVEGRFRGLASFGSARLGAGFAVAWHSMGQKTRTSIESDNATITGTQVRDLGATSLLAKATLALGELDKVAPYFGLGIGPSRVLRRLDIGIYRITRESWHFALEPELGVELPVGPVLGLAAVRFNYMVGNSKAPEQMYLNFSVGAGFN